MQPGSLERQPRYPQTDALPVAAARSGVSHPPASPWPPPSGHARSPCCRLRPVPARRQLDHPSGHGVVQFFTDARAGRPACRPSLLLWQSNVTTSTRRLLQPGSTRGDAQLQRHDETIASSCRSQSHRGRTAGNLVLHDVPGAIKTNGETFGLTRAGCTSGSHRFGGRENAGLRDRDYLESLGRSHASR